MTHNVLYDDFGVLSTLPTSCFLEFPQLIVVGEVPLRGPDAGDSPPPENICSSLLTVSSIALASDTSRANSTVDLQRQNTCNINVYSQLMASHNQDWLSIL